MPTFYEFFAGGGMVRSGLGPAWDCLLANDIDPKKTMAYQANWGADGELRVDDVANIAPDDLRGAADLAWASFPCQDLSLAGGGAGLMGARSGAFFPFWRLMTALIEDGRGPKIIALENVTGTLSSHDGKDFSELCRALLSKDYRTGALVINAALFVPQSRPRLFIIGVRKDVSVPESLLSPEPLEPFHPRRLVTACKTLDGSLSSRLVWWNLPTPPLRTTAFAELIEDDPQDVSWRSKHDTDKLLAMMSPINKAKVSAAQRAGRRMVGTIYRRTRENERGERVQRAEVRFDDTAGCLRTPAGGSSRQTILVVDGRTIRSRLISARETARLMGLPEDYKLPRNYNEAYHLTGDGVVVPVVRHLATHLFEPLLGVATALEHSQAAQRQAHGR